MAPDESKTEQGAPGGDLAIGTAPEASAAGPAPDESTEAVASTLAAASLPEAPGRPASFVGRHIGHYRLVRELGRGGMGAVYEATHERIGGRAAVKVMFPALARDPEFVERFFYEARVVNLVRHEGLVKVYDHGELEDGTLYIQMEFLEGRSLADRLEEASVSGAPFPLPLCLQIGRQVAAALTAIHEQGIVHRDLKPANLQLVPDALLSCGARVKIVDFGIAKAKEPDAAGGDRSRLTMAGRILGTPLYMSPEQCQQQDAVDGKADVYSLGVILYEILSGHPPFEDESIAKLLGMHILKEPPPLAAGAPPALAELVHQMLAKDPTARPDAAAVAEALLAIEAGATPAPGARSGAVAQKEPPRRWRYQLPLALGICVLLGGGALGLQRWRGALPAGMVRIPGGTYQMGSEPTDAEEAFSDCQRELGKDACSPKRHQRETPVREIVLSPFLLDQTEVTNVAYARWLDALAMKRPLVLRDDWIWDGAARLVNLYPIPEAPSGLVQDGAHFRARPGLERRPVSRVSWEGARRYCAARGGRLPTEAEWEYAARGAGGGRRYPWGQAPPRCEFVVFARDAGMRCAHLPHGAADVGTARWDRTPLGLFDLAGNVAEWVEDRFQDPYPDCPAPCRDPQAPEGGDGTLQRSFRGGDWFSPASACRAAARSRFDPDRALENVGFRCAGR